MYSTIKNLAARLIQSTVLGMLAGLAVVAVLLGCGISEPVTEALSSAVCLAVSGVVFAS